MGSVFCCDDKPVSQEFELSNKKHHPVVEDFWYATEIVKNSNIYQMECRHAFEYGKECKAILPPELLLKYYEDVKNFYIKIKSLNGPLGRRDIYERFILDQRLWVIHQVHYSMCRKDQVTSTYAARGLSLCTAVNSHVYAWNVFGSDTSLGCQSETMQRFSNNIRKEMIPPPKPVVRKLEFLVPPPENNHISDSMPNTPFGNVGSDDSSDDDGPNPESPLLATE